MPAVTRFVCQQCGAETPKWEGKCHECGSWGSLVEVARSKKASNRALAAPAGLIRLDQVEVANHQRLSSGFGELDRVLGGGVVPGSVVLIGGEPGIGKSTLLLQIALNTGGLYVSAEESAHQVKLRADRLGGRHQQVSILPTSNVDQAIATIQSATAVPLVIIDSIQTVTTEDLDGVPGSIGQVRESANRLVELAKQRAIPLFIVSHVTKEGVIAGPKALEHIVDTVIYLEGQEHSATRLVRSIKNRFGPVHEVGLFQLQEQGLAEVINPHELLSENSGRVSGSAVTVSMEGARPIMLEVEALTSKTSFGLPRRTANGMDYNRLLMLVAVLSKRARLALSDQDIYTNIAGGIKMSEAALDLPTCLALASSLSDIPLKEGTVSFGEVSLSGEIKPVVGQQKRLEQAQRLGYKHAVYSGNAKNISQAINQALQKPSPSR